MIKTILAITAVYFVAAVGWITLAGTISYRTDHQDADLKHAVIWSAATASPLWLWFNRS